jgi:arylsulfatase
MVRPQPNLALLPLLLILGAGCGPSEPDQRGIFPVGTLSKPADIVLITVDTLRADHLGCYGYFRDTSPRLDQFASEGILFKRAIATMGTTLPSHLSLFTGLYPHQHGHVANKRARVGPFEAVEGRSLAAVILREEGWRTAAFVSAGPVKRTTGIQVGFDKWSQPKDLQREGKETVAEVLAWMETDLSPEPTFLWIHLWDPHEPNNPPPEYKAMFTTDANLEALVDRMAVNPQLLQGKFDKKEVARLFFPDLLEPLQLGEDLDLPSLSREHVLDLLNRYDADIRYTDDCLGQIFDALKSRGRWDQSLVVVVGDHGQGLGQHDWMLHGRINGENLHVPLVIKLPLELGVESLQVERVVSLVDVFPTIFSRMGGRAAERFLAQASGSDLLSGEFNRRWAFSHRTERGQEWEAGRKFAITTRLWKYYHLEKGPDSLFDLAADPGELRDVATEHQALMETFAKITQQVLADRVAEKPGSVSGEMTEEERHDLEELRRLGYAGDDEEDG